jgi:hypothetical protein
VLRSDLTSDETGLANTRADLDRTSPLFRFLGFKKASQFGHSTV